MTTMDHHVRISEWEDLPEGFSPVEPLYVLTDIHGCVNAMARLLAQRPADTSLVFLGDAVDRGPWPVEVLTRLLADSYCHLQWAFFLPCKHQAGK
ncbi:MAG: metallophosphoesterase [Desulfovibrio sp.]|nr:metallophosphoesterase [Desulfovibrio sp.]